MVEVAIMFFLNIIFIFCKNVIKADIVNISPGDRNSCLLRKKMNITHILHKINNNYKYMHAKSFTSVDLYTAIHTLIIKLTSKRLFVKSESPMMNNTQLMLYILQQHFSFNNKSHTLAQTLIILHIRYKRCLLMVASDLSICACAIETAYTHTFTCTQYTDIEATD